jgi:signal transduction histidine kinase
MKKFSELFLRPSLLSALAVVLAAIEILVDAATWIQLNIAIIYSLPLVLAAAARNRRLLWILVSILVAATFLVYWQQIPPGVAALQDEYFLNRVLAALSLVLVAGLLHALSLATEALRSRNTELSRIQLEITQRNRELDQLRLHAEEASERKTRLLMSVSHDVRTPLTAINLMAELIGNASADPSLVPKLPGLAHNLQSNAATLADLVTDVLDIAYFDSGRIELRETEFSLNDLLAEECRSLEPLAEAKDLALKPELPPQALWLRADRIKLARVLRNLVNNAIQFTAAGSITVSPVLTAERGLLIRVADTGKGIAPENLEGIFAEFARLRAAQSGESAGWGLGLAICRRLTRLMGGDVAVESAPGRGSTFIIHLPPSRVLQRGPALDCASGA